MNKLVLATENIYLEDTDSQGIEESVFLSSTNRFYCVNRTGENPLGLVDTTVFSWPPVKDKSWVAYWGDLWHKFDVSIWWQHHGLGHVVDQDIQWFITNEKMRSFLEEKRPDIFEYYGLAHRNVHHAGTVFETLYYLEDGFRSSYWSTVDLPDHLPGYCWKECFEPELAEMLPLGRQPSLRLLEHYGANQDVLIRSNGITAHVHPLGVPIRELLSTQSWVRLGMQSGNWVMAPNTTIICNCNRTFCGERHDCGARIPCVLPSCTQHEWEATWGTSLLPEGPSMLMTADKDWIYCDNCERPALWQYATRSYGVVNRCGYHSNSNTARKLGKIHGERVLQEWPIQRGNPDISLFQTERDVRDGIYIGLDRVDVSYDIACGLLFRADGTPGILLSNFLARKDASISRSKKERNDAMNPKSIRVKIPGGRQQSRRFVSKSLEMVMEHTLCEARADTFDPLVISGIERTLKRMLPCNWSSMEGGNDIDICSMMDTSFSDVEGGPALALGASTKVNLRSAQAGPRIGIVPENTKTINKQENLESLLQTEPGYCYLAYWNTEEERISAARRFGAWPKVSQLPRGFRKTMRVNSMGSRTHCTKNGTFVPFHYQRVGGKFIDCDLKTRGGETLWYNRWMCTTQVEHLYSLRLSVRLKNGRKAMKHALKFLGIDGKDFHPCLMYRPTDAHYNAFGAWLHSQEFMVWADAVIEGDEMEIDRAIRERPAVMVIWFCLQVAGGILGLTHVLAKASICYPYYRFKQLFQALERYRPKAERHLKYLQESLTTRAKTSVRSFNRYACLMVEEANEVLLSAKQELQSAGEVMVDKVKEMASVPRNRFSQVKYQVQEAMDLATGWVEPSLETVGKAERWMSKYGLSTREKVKVAWAPLVPYRVPNKISHARIRLPETGKQVFVRAPYDEALDWHARLLASPLDCDPNLLIERSNLVRQFNGSPYHDIHLSYQRKHHPLFDDVPEGIDGLQLANAEALWLSMERYGPREDPVHLMSDAEKDSVAQAMYWQNPGLYAHSQLRNWHFLQRPSIIRGLIKNLDASAGIPLLHLKTKKDMWKAGILTKAAQAGIDLFYADQVYPSVVHVFPKSYVVARHKVDPAKGGSLSALRTILGVPLHIQVRGRIVNGDINDRRDPWHSPGKPGMPLTGSAFNKIYQDAEKFKFHYSLDGTKYDSTVAGQILNVSTRLRKLGYKWHPDYEKIAAVLDVMEKSLLEAHLVNLWAQPNSPFRTMWKFGGMMTGHESVTEDNTETLQIVIIATLCKLWDLLPQQVLAIIALENVGDDNFFHCDRKLDEDKFIQIAREISGVQFRIEDRSTKVSGVEFLSKTGFPMTPSDLEELESYGIDTAGLKYKALHNRKTLLMRYSGLKQDGMHRRKASSRDPFIRTEYMLDRINGYALLCAHHPDIHKFLQQERDWYFSQVKNEEIRARLRKLKKLKFPSYAKIMRLWYAPLNIPKSMKGLAPVWLAYWDASNLGFYNLDRNLRALRNVSNSLDPEFWDLPDIPLYDLPAKVKYWKPTFQVEAFIFWRNMEYEWPKDTRGKMIRNAAVPVLGETDMVALARQSPFFGTTDVRLFCEVILPHMHKMCMNHPDPSTLITEMAIKWRFRMTILSLIYSGLALSVSALPAGVLSVGPLFFDLYNSATRRLYSWLSYAYWLDKGRGNAVISNMVPKDQFGAYKQMAVMLLSKIPMAFTLPDLLPFLHLDIGGGLEKVATFVNYVQGLSTPSVHSVKSALSEAGLKGDKWQTITEECLARLKLTEKRAIILDAPTGTGKTFYFPQYVQQQTTLQISFHIILVPTRILLQETRIPGAIQVSRSRPWNLGYNGGIFIMTFGYAKAIWNRLSAHMDAVGPHRVLFQLDELHFEQPQQVWLNAKIRLAKYWRVVSTATPSFEIIREEFPKYVAPLRRPHEIHHCSVLENIRAVYIADRVLKSKSATTLGINKRLLIVEPSEKECDKICESLRAHAHEYETGFKIHVVSRHRSDVPQTGHIVITQMGRTGLTIPGISCVIGGHEIVSHYGCVQNRPLSFSGMIQEKGRTGRTNDGLYIQSTSKLSESVAVQVSDPIDCLENIDLYNAEGRYYFETPLRKIPSDIQCTRLNEWLAHDRLLDARESYSLRIYLQARHIFHDIPVDEGNLLGQIAYENLVGGHYMASTEHIIVDLTLLLPFEDIQHLIPGIFGLSNGVKAYGTLSFQGRKIHIGTLQACYLFDRGKPVYKDEFKEQGLKAIEQYIDSLLPLTDNELNDYTSTER